jgi:hypothetical protein
MKLLIDYEAIARSPAAAIKRIQPLFVRAGLAPISVEGDGKTKRTSGISWREVVLTFADSQKLALRVKATGDVYEVLLNGKKVPVKEQDDPAKAVSELVRMVDTGRAKFQKRMAAMQMKPPEGLKTAAPKLREALVAQIAEVEKEIEVAREELTAIEAA